MKIKIDDKEFFGVFYLEKAKIRIELTSDDDLLFFARWHKIRNGKSIKSGYNTPWDVKQISYETKTREGMIINAYPLLDINEDFVELAFDNITVKWKEF